MGMTPKHCSGARASLRQYSVHWVEWLSTGECSGNAGWSDGTWFQGGAHEDPSQQPEGGASRATPDMAEDERWNMGSNQGLPCANHVSLIPVLPPQPQDFHVRS